eukprot:Awhi_evm1s13235
MRALRWLRYSHEVYDTIQQPSFTSYSTELINISIFGRVSGNDTNHTGIPIFMQQFGVKKANVKYVYTLFNLITS